jgi:hypothetical protein
MTERDYINQIGVALSTARKEFLEVGLELEQAEHQLAVDTDAINIRYNQSRAALETQKEEIRKYERIAEDNTDLRPSNDANPVVPNISRLSRLVDAIRPGDYHDSSAALVVGLVGGYLAYIDAQIGSLEKERSKKLQGAKDAAAAKKVTIAARQQQIMRSCEELFRGGAARSAYEMIGAKSRLYDTCGRIHAYRTGDRMNQTMLLGYEQLQLMAPKSIYSAAKSGLNEFFDESTGKITVPVCFDIAKCRTITVEYSEANESELKSGIMSLLLNYIRLLPASTFKISVFDYIRRNSDLLGQLYPLSKEKGSPVDAAASSGETLKQNMSMLVSYYSKVNAKIGAENIFKYNRTADAGSRVPLRLLIINKMDVGFGFGEDQELQYLLNNADKFGITVLYLLKKQIRTDNASSFGKRMPKADEIYISTDENGRFLLKSVQKWHSFAWNRAPAMLPPSFVSDIAESNRNKIVGTQYFNRYPVRTPMRSHGKRKPISVEFGIDDNDAPVGCVFDAENFAAYISGAAGSGKSTLLHTIICGLVMDYHPDELELWLLDYKKTEFERYIRKRPPQVRYLLLEKSEDLTFDVLNKLTDEMLRRQALFQKNGWADFKDVPPETNLPAVFLVVDEFAQMSQIIHETIGESREKNYSLKLENLLRDGRAFGFRFIFSDQTYTSGVNGLSESARKQIQMRLAMKNSPEEIRETLMLPLQEITPEISRDIAGLPPYETLFNRRGEDGGCNVLRLKNMWVEKGEEKKAIDAVNKALHPVKGRAAADDEYTDKNPVLIGGGEPKTYKSQLPYYNAYLAGLDKNKYDSSDVFIFPGVPRSFEPARPFLLCNAAAENVLVAGGSSDDTMNILLSVMNSYIRSCSSVQIWTHGRAEMYREFRATVLSNVKMVTDTAELCGRITALKTAVAGRKASGTLIVCLGLERLYEDFELCSAMGETGGIGPEPQIVRPEQDGAPDLAAVQKLLSECSDPAERKQIISEYNARADKQNGGDAGGNNAGNNAASAIYDARADLGWLMKYGPTCGVHFVVAFRNTSDIKSMRLDGHLFRHKLLFPLSKDDSYDLTGSNRANSIEAGSVMYTDGREFFTVSPHIYHGVTCGGWKFSQTGEIIRDVRGG